MQLLSSSRRFDLDMFSKFCFDTYHLYIAKYLWYYVPTSLHKVLIHGADVINSFTFHSIGTLSEEALESCHKLFKFYRCNLSGKFSREASNLDVLHRLLLQSDPVLFYNRKHIKKPDTDYLPDVAAMFIDD